MWDQRGMTPLTFVICWERSYKKIEELPKEGACVNRLDNLERAPLDYAVFSSPALYDLLVVHGGTHSERFLFRTNPYLVTNK